MEEGTTEVPNGAKAADPLPSTVVEGVPEGALAGSSEASPVEEGSKDPPNIEKGSPGSIATVGGLATEDAVPSREEGMVARNGVATISEDGGESLCRIRSPLEGSGFALAAMEGGVSSEGISRADAITPPMVVEGKAGAEASV